MLIFGRFCGKNEHSTLAKTRLFSTRKLLAENKRVLRGFAKWLTDRRLRRFWQNLRPSGFQKSTPFENLALTFENLACLKKRETGQKMRKKLHRTMRFVQNLTLILTFSRSPSLPQKPKTVKKRPFFAPECLPLVNFLLVEILNTIRHLFLAQNYSALWKNVRNFRNSHHHQPYWWASPVVWMMGIMKISFLFICLIGNNFVFLQLHCVCSPCCSDKRGERWWMRCKRHRG